MDLSRYKHDVKAQDEGEWIEVPDLGWRLKVKSNRTHRFRDRLQKQLRRVTLGGGREAPSTATIEAITVRVLIDECLVDWDRDTFTMDGEPIPFSRENAHKYIGDTRQWPMLKDALDWAAGRVGVPDLLAADDDDTEAPANGHDPMLYVEPPEEAVVALEKNLPPPSEPPAATPEKSEPSSRRSPRRRETTPTSTSETTNES